MNGPVTNMDSEGIEDVLNEGQEGILASKPSHLSLKCEERRGSLDFYEHLKTLGYQLISAAQR